MLGKRFSDTVSSSDTLIEWIHNCLNWQIVHKPCVITNYWYHIAHNIWLSFTPKESNEYKMKHTKWVRNAKIIIIKFMLEIFPFSMPVQKIKWVLHISDWKILKNGENNWDWDSYLHSCTSWDLFLLQINFSLLVTPRRKSYILFM